MVERAVENDPQEIKDMLMHPYIYFSDMFGNDKDKLLDLACGTALQKNILEKKFNDVTYMDIDPQEDFIVKGNVTEIPLEDNSVDIIFSFETIEHVTAEEQLKMLEEYKRVARKFVVIGTIDEYGEDYVNDIVVYKARLGLNPYHLCELNTLTFPQTIETVFKNVDYKYSTYNTDLKTFEMFDGLKSRPKIYNMYAIIDIEKNK